MAINPNAMFPTKTDTGSTDYPRGSARDVTVTGDGTGTPWDYRILNDFWGFFQKLMQTAAVTPSLLPDTAVLSDYYFSLMRSSDQRNIRYINTPIYQDTASRIGEIRTASDIDQPYSTANIITDSVSDYRNCCRGWNPDTGEEVAYFLIDGDDSQIISIEHRDTDFSPVQTSLAITLPANHVPDSIASDGSHVYILCHSAGSGTAGVVHKFARSPSWSATPVWSTTLTGAIDDSRDGSSVIKIADSLRIAVLLNGAELTSGVNPIAILNKSTGVETEGRGTYASTSGGKPGQGMCMAGGYVWFIVDIISSDVSVIHNALITNPANASAVHASGVTLPSMHAGRIDTNGTLIAIPTVKVPTILTGSISVFDTTKSTGTGNPYIDFFVFKNTVATASTFPVCQFDGSKFWTYWNHSAGNDNSYLVPFDLNSFYYGADPVQVFNPYTFTAPPDSVVQVSDAARMCFADGCLWLIPDANSTINSIPAQRIPRLMTRY